MLLMLIALKLLQPVDLLLDVHISCFSKEAYYILNSF